MARSVSSSASNVSIRSCNSANFASLALIASREISRLCYMFSEAQELILFWDLPFEDTLRAE